MHLKLLVEVNQEHNVNVSILTINSELWFYMMQYLQITVKCKLGIQTRETTVHTPKNQFRLNFLINFKKKFVKICQVWAKIAFFLCQRA